MDIMYNNHMNDDQQNTNQQPPVLQATPTAQPLPSQPPVIANQQPAVSNQSLPPSTSPAQIPPNPAPVNTNQPNSTVQPPAALPPNSAAPGYSGPDNSAGNFSWEAKNYPGLTYHMGRLTAMSFLGLVVIIIIGSITNTINKPYGTVLLVNVWLLPTIFFSVNISVRATWLKWIRDMSGVMCITDIILFLIHLKVGVLGGSSPGSTRPSLYVSDPSLLSLPLADMLITIGIYMLFIIPLGIAYLVARVMYKREIGQNRS